MTRPRRNKHVRSVLLLVLSAAAMAVGKGLAQSEPSAIGGSVIDRSSQSRQSASSSPTTHPNEAADAARDVELERRLAGIDQLASGIADLTADFVQLKRTPLLRKPLESRGRLLVKGDAMRWDTASPSKGVLAMNERELRLYSAEHKLLEVYPLEHGLAQLAASPLPRLHAVRRHFEVRAGQWPEGARGLPDVRDALSLTLVPREDSLREHVRQVDVVIDAAIGCARRVRTINPDGEELELTFSAMRFNTGLRDEQLRFDPPPGTTISRPLEPQR